MPLLRAHAGFFRLLTVGISDLHVLLPFDKKLISYLVMGIRTRDYTVPEFKILTWALDLVVRTDKLQFLV